MTRELLGISISIGLIASAVVATWIACNRWIPQKPRRWVRWFYAALVLVFGGPLIVEVVGSRIGEGDVLCFECGRSRRELNVSSICIPIGGSTESRGVGPVSNEYEAAFPSSAIPGHAHVWIPVGCHESGIGLGRLICCTMIGPCQWYRDLPQLADRTLATALATRLAGVDEAEKREVIRSYDFAADDGATVEERVKAWRGAWAERHPDWP